MFPKQGENKMKNQYRSSKEKLDSGVIPIVLTIDDVPIELRRKSANEPTYVDHL
jgi:hypothetical protein